MEPPKISESNLNKQKNSSLDFNQNNSSQSKLSRQNILIYNRMDLSSPTDCGGGFDDLFVPRSSQLTTAGEDLLLYGRSVSSDTSSSGRETSTNTRLDRLDRCLTLPPPP